MQALQSKLSDQRWTLTSNPCASSSCLRSICTRSTIAKQTVMQVMQILKVGKKNSALDCFMVILPWHMRLAMRLTVCRDASGKLIGRGDGEHQSS